MREWLSEKHSGVRSRSGIRGNREAGAVTSRIWDTWEARRGRGRGTGAQAGQQRWGWAREPRPTATNMAPGKVGFAGPGTGHPGPAGPARPHREQRAQATHRAERGAAEAPEECPEKSFRGRGERAQRPPGSSSRRRRRGPGSRRSWGSRVRPAGPAPWDAQPRQVQLPRLAPLRRRWAATRRVPGSRASSRSAAATSRCPRTRRPAAPPGEPLPPSPTLAQLVRQQPGSTRHRAAHSPRSVSRATAAPARRLAAHPRSERGAQLALQRPPVSGAAHSPARRCERRWGPSGGRPPGLQASPTPAVNYSADRGVSLDPQGPLGRTCHNLRWARLFSVFRGFLFVHFLSSVTYIIWQKSDSGKIKNWWGLFYSIVFSFLFFSPHTHPLPFFP